jgi:hypothetical protein
MIPEYYEGYHSLSKISRVERSETEQRRGILLNERRVFGDKYSGRKYE